MNPEATEPTAKPRRKWLWITFGSVAAVILAAFALQILLYFLHPPVAIKEARAKGEAITLCTSLRAYCTEYGDGPSGDNKSIIHTLEGSNPRKIVFLEFPAQSRSPQGEFLDPWATPYHIDVSDPKNPKVYSFGPNRKDDGGTGDDVVSWR